MARLFQLVFSSSLIVSKNDSELCLPSPESLKGKIILKGKAGHSPPSSDSEILWEKIATDAVTLPISQLTHQIVYCKKIHFSGFPVHGNFKC
jgi:hypothetical protein